MEADWEFEVGSDAPIIEAHWPGFVDLRKHPYRARELTEVRQLPGLENALALMNAAHSPVWTSKTDVFDPGQIDCDELDATRETAQHAIACYIDLLMRGDRVWNIPFKAEQSCRVLCKRLREVPLRCCRIDVVVRRAYIHPDIHDLGATVYLAACGRSEGDAKARLAECLTAFVDAIITTPK